LNQERLGRVSGDAEHYASNRVAVNIQGNIEYVRFAQPENISQLLEEIEHFCRCHQEQVAKIVHCGVTMVTHLHS